MWVPNTKARATMLASWWSTRWPKPPTPDGASSATPTAPRCATLVLIKPTTYMNLSGKAVKYWLQAEKIELENLLVVSDDIALEVGTMRMKKQGSGGGHNGLGDIEAALGTQAYCRLRIGVGSNFGRGHQIDYVLGQFTDEERAALEPVVDEACETIRCFATQGPDRAMNLHNGKKRTV